MGRFCATSMSRASRSRPSPSRRWTSSSRLLRFLARSRSSRSPRVDASGRIVDRRTPFMTSNYVGNLVRDSRTTEQWLARRPAEKALEPDLPIIDAHHHLWDHREKGIRYLFEDFQADLHAGHRIVSTVFVEASSMYRASGPEHLRPVGEVEFARGMAAMAASGIYGETRVAEAIVGCAD